MAGLLLGAISLTLRIWSGSDEAEAVGIKTLRGWYSGDFEDVEPVIACRNELINGVPTPEMVVVSGSYPVFPVGRYHVIIFIGAQGKWYSVEYIVSGGHVLKCFVGPSQATRREIQQRARKW